MTPVKAEVLSDLHEVRRASPLVHNITNYVVMNNTANALLAVGASPIMAHAIEEVEEMVSISQALVINIGTLSEPWILAMQKAIRKAKQLKKPVILDPVGAGASNFRNTTIRRLFEAGYPTIIRGNASEILSTLKNSGKGKGVDATESSESALETGQTLSQETGAVVVISGATDYILQSDKVLRVFNGDPMMTKVTGLGCTASALCGAFAAIQPNPWKAAASAMTVMGIAGEIAKETTKGPGSFQVDFLDALYNMGDLALQKHWKTEP